MYVRRMRDRIVRLLRSPRVQGAGDAVLAAVLAFTSVIPVLGGDPSWGKPKALGVALGLLSTVPIAWRSRYPLSVAAIVLAANGACIYAAAPHQAAFQPFLALVLAGYSAGSRAEGRRALWVPAVMAVLAIPLFWAAVRHGQDPGNAIPSYVWLVAAWAAGRTGRSWRLKSTALERANRELAEQRELQAQAAVAVERGRIARELHNVVAHNVSMMVVQAGAAARVLHGEQPDVRNALEVIAATGRETVDEMRTLLGVLRSDDGPDALKPQPGLADLEHLVSGVREAGLPVTLRFEGAPRAAAPGARPFRFPDRPGGPDQLAEARRAGSGPGDGPLPGRGGGAGDRGHRPRPGGQRGHAATAVRGTRTARAADGPARADGTAHGLVGMRERAAIFGGELETARRTAAASPSEPGYPLMAPA